MPVKERGVSVEDAYVIGYNFSIYDSPGFPFGTEHVQSPGSNAGCYLNNGGFHEKISYETPRFTRYGNCNHYKFRGTLLQTPYWYNAPAGKDYWIGNRAGHFRHVDLDEESVVNLNIPNLVKEAYQTMKPSLQAGFSLTNFLVELTEFKTMFKLFTPHKGFVKSATKNTAGGYLNYQFGWKLFIKDCQEIYEKCTNFEKTLNDYKSQQGKLLVRHFAYIPDREFLKGELNEGWVKSWKVCDVGVEFHATMTYRYTVPNLDRAYSKLRAVGDILGIKLTQSVIWEAIPFSFVIDWFVNVGDYLQQLETDYLESVVEIVDFCYSTKKTYSYKQWVCGQPAYNPDVKHDLATWQVTQYERVRTIPRDDELFGLRKSDRYGTKQILLSSALLLS